MRLLIGALSILADAGQAAGSVAAHDGVPTEQNASAQKSQPDDIVVMGRRGAADIAPETELGADEIDALNAYDIGEVIARIARSKGLGDHPLIIVNGRPTADPDVFSRFPPDALVRVEVLPRDAGARYGGNPSRRVINIVLQPRFKSRDGQFEAKAPTADGTLNLVGDLRQGAISGNDTTQLGMRATRDSALLGEERPDYIEDHPGNEAVSLRPSAETVAANLAMTRALGNWSSSLNVQGQVQGDRSVSLTGAALVESRHTTRSLWTIGGLSGSLAGWSLQASLTGQLSATNQSGLADTDSRQQSLAISLSATRGLFNLPAGPVFVNLSTQASSSRTSSEAAGADQTFSARNLNVSSAVALPLWRALSPDSGSVLARILGTMSATLGASLRRTDDGRGTGLDAGLAWAPSATLRLTGNWSTSTDGVPDAQRFTPQYYGSPITVFDFSTGESAQVLPILGGTPNLRAPHNDRKALSILAGPFSPWNLSWEVNLQRSNATDSIGSLPAITPELEAAFPGRFQREDGRLTVIDLRPINFDSALTDSLSSDLGATFPLGKASSDTLRMTIRYSLQLRNIAILRAGLPRMDLLAGDGGGASRQQFDMQADARRGRLGVNMAARWHSGYRTRRGSGEDSPDDLLISSIGTIDLKLSYALERVIPPSEDGGTPRRGAGVQFGLEVDNLFDTRPGARLGNGGTAPGYGHDDQDPIGRTMRLTVRNRF
jgi:hypothetical protein